MVNSRNEHTFLSSISLPPDVELAVEGGLNSLPVPTPATSVSKALVASARHVAGSPISTERSGELACAEVSKMFEKTEMDWQNSSKK